VLGQLSGEDSFVNLRSLTIQVLANTCHSSLSDSLHWSPSHLHSS